MKWFSILLLLVFSLIIFTKNTHAKVLPQAAKSGKSAVVKTAGTGISVSPKIRNDRRALTVNFGNLQNAKAVSYSLTYSTSTQVEGAMGGLTLGNSSTNTQELLFGTCSKNVCRYHTGITNMKLEVSYTSKTGGKYIKRYKVRV